MIGRASDTGYQKLEPSTPADESRLVGMLLSGQAPRCVTDALFTHGHANGSQFVGDEARGEMYRKQYRKRHGRNPPKDAVYMSSISSYPGEGFVTNRSEAAQMARKNGISLEGIVNVECPEPAPKPRVKLAEDIVQEEIQLRLAINPSLKTKDRRELREQVIHEHGNPDL